MPCGHRLRRPTAIFSLPAILMYHLCASQSRSCSLPCFGIVRSVEKGTQNLAITTDGTCFFLPDCHFSGTQQLPPFRSNAPAFLLSFTSLGSLTPQAGEREQKSRSIRSEGRQLLCTAEMAIREKETCCGSRDREILRAFFHATDNAKAGQRAAAALGSAKMIHQDGWKCKDGCGSSQPMAAWHGVTTNAEGRVIGLELDGNRLARIIPPQLGDLDVLKQLSLRMNRLEGDIPPELGKFPQYVAFKAFHP